MIKFKKTKRAELRTNIKTVNEITKVLGQLINLIKEQQEQINDIKTTFNNHRHRSGGTGYNTQGPIEQIFIT